MLLVTAQGHVLLQTEGQGRRGKRQGVVMAAGLDAPPDLRLRLSNPVVLRLSPY